MRTTTQPIGSANFTEDTDESQTLMLDSITLTGIVVPVDSPLDGKTASFISIFEAKGIPAEDSQFTVTDDGGSTYTINLVAGTHIMIPETISRSLIQFRIKLNSDTTEDALLHLVGLNG